LLADVLLRSGEQRIGLLRGEHEGDKGLWRIGVDIEKGVFRDDLTSFEISKEPSCREKQGVEGGLPFLVLCFQSKKKPRG
jgi:hypothetical protein